MKVYGKGTSLNLNPVQTVKAKLQDGTVLAFETDATWQQIRDSVRRHHGQAVVEFTASTGKDPIIGDVPGMEDEDA